MASKSLCDTCSRRNKESVATKFCSDCENALCTECLDSHAMFKAFDSHHIVDVSLASDQSLVVNKHCSKHQEMVLELFCSDHDTLCCRSCMVVDHRTCEKLVPLDVAAKGVRMSTMFDDVFKDIEKLNNTADELESEKIKARSTLVENKDAARQKVKDFTASIIKRIHEIESKTLSEIDSMFLKLSSELDQGVNNTDKHVKQVREISRQFDLIAKHWSENQIFLLLNSLKPNVFKVSTETVKLIESIKITDLAFNESDLLSKLNTLGSVVVNERPSDVKYKPTKNQQAQIFQTGHIISKFNLLKKCDISICGNTSITGIAVTKDNRLIMCNESGHNLDVLTDDGQLIKKVTLSGRPWGIALAKDTDEAWVTLPHMSKVTVVNTETYSLIRQVDVPRNCCGITFIDNDVALGGKGKVYVINKQGIRLCEFSIDTGYVHSLSAKSAKVLYCCAADDNKFFCLNLNGTKEFSYSSQELNRPIGVNTDAHGNVYVIGYKSNNLHRFTSDGQFKEIMLTSSDGLNRLFTFAFSRDHSKMFIPNYDGKTLLVFSCVRIFIDRFENNTFN